MPVPLIGRVLAHPKIHNLYWDDAWNAHNPDAPPMEQLDAFTRTSLPGRIVVAPYWSDQDTACVPIPPRSTLTVGFPQYPGAFGTFVTSATPFDVSATDGGSGLGVASISYRDFPQGSLPPAYTTIAGASAEFTVSGADGFYEVDTFATGNNGARQSPLAKTIRLDNTPPQSSLTIGLPQYPAGASQPFVTSATPFTLNATDGGAGVQSVSYRVSASWSTASSYTTLPGSTTQFTVSGPDGSYEIDTFAIDRLGNVETRHVQLVTLDTTGPALQITQP